jgi:hypothetical protein
MRIPLEITAKWAALGATDDVDRNLEAIAAIRSWLDEAEAGLSAGTGSTKEPKMYGHAKTNARGVTHADFDGVDTATLRHWLAWWSDPVRSAHGREEAGRDPATEAARISREIEARPLP